MKWRTEEFKVSSTHLTIKSVGGYFDNILQAHLSTKEVKKRDRIMELLCCKLWDCDKEFNMYFLLEIIQKFRPDLIYLCGTCVHEYLIGNGYNLYKSKEGTLLIRNEIVEVPIINDMWFEIKSMNLILGNLNRIDNKIIKQWNENGVNFFGELNMEYKNQFNNNNYFNVTESKTLGYIGKKVEIKELLSPIQENMIIVKSVENVRCSIYLRLGRIKEDIGQKEIVKILNGNDIKINVSYKNSFCFKRFSSEIENEDYIINRLLFNDIKYVYKKYNALWTGERREPFLGSNIPNSVIFSYKELLKHKINKRYRKLTVPLYVNSDLLNKQELEMIKSLKGKAGLKWLKKQKFAINGHSKAINFELFQLKDITVGCRAWLERAFKAFRGNNKGKISFYQSVIRRMISNLNKQHNKLIAKSFFLMKNPKLENANDTRMIIITPIWIKLFEIFVYRDITVYANNKLKDGANRYQHGGRHGMSTYSAMVEIREKKIQLGGDGIVNLDISKGYESVDLDKLYFIINDFFQESRIQWLALCWLRLVQNMDILVGDCVLKRTCGIPMGLMLSPLMFILYLDRALNNIDKEYLTVYLDDINILVFNDKSMGANDSINYVKRIESNLKRYNLNLNWRKVCLISDDTELKAKFKLNFPNMTVGSDGKFLGKELKFINGRIESNDEKLILNNQIRKIAVVRKFENNLFIKKLIFNGGLDSKARFKANMFEIHDIKVKEKMYNMALDYFNSCFYRPSYYKIILLINNYFRNFCNFLQIKRWYEYDNTFHPDEDDIIWNRRSMAIYSWLKCGIKELDDGLDLLCDKFNVYYFNDIRIQNDAWNTYKIFTNEVWRAYIFYTLGCAVNKGEIKIKKVLDLWNLMIDNKILMKFACIVDGLFFDLDPENSEFDLFVMAVLDWILRLMEELSKNNVWDISLEMSKRKIKLYNKEEALQNITVDFDRTQENMRNFCYDLLHLYWAYNKDEDKLDEDNADVRYWSQAKLFKNDKDLIKKELHFNIPRNLIEENKQIKIINKWKKKRKKVLKNAFRDIIRKLIILDEIYCDNSMRMASYNDLISYFSICEALNEETINKQLTLFSKYELFQLINTKDGMFNIDLDFNNKIMSNIEN